MVRSVLALLDGVPTHKWLLAPGPDGISQEIRQTSKVFSANTSGQLLPRTQQIDGTALPLPSKGGDRCMANAVGQPAVGNNGSYRRRCKTCLRALCPRRCACSSLSPATP